MLEEQPQLAVGTRGRSRDRRAHVAMARCREWWRRRGRTPEAYVTRAALARITGDTRVSTLLIRARDRDAAAQSALLARVRDAISRRAGSR